ncbi:PREDICTED: putative disease resistance protein RGA1 [Populus euphratica]|uniref:Disease resistance protein RGA1 n=1 Tax=Populus euphratica TaxID=75702 RepID=A0AAJ6U1K0_POPEU|nr:PREDICTED: putative disease resistance protein RGA1 [Populus euphratica]
MERSEEVLCGLQPHSNLKQLCISGYQGIKFPNWMMDSLLPNLVQISVEECCSCERLPPLGKLQFLKNLRLKSVKGLKYISRDVYGDEEIPFPSLESLTLDSMQSLEAWTNTAGTGRDSFPCLREITVCNCAKLVDLPTIPSVRTLKIKNSSAASLLSVRNFTSLAFLSIENFCDLTNLPDGMVKNHAFLERLEIVRRRNLKSPSNQLDNLFALPDGMVKNHAVLERLEINVMNLKACQGSAITDRPRAFGISSLPNQIGHLMSLSYLHISDCPDLMSLPDGVKRLNVLKELEIEECPNLERRCNKETGEDWLKVAHIPEIVINSEEIQSLGSWQR